MSVGEAGGVIQKNTAFFCFLPPNATPRFDPSPLATISVSRKTRRNYDSGFRGGIVLHGYRVKDLACYLGCGTE